MLRHRHLNFAWALCLLALAGCASNPFQYAKSPLDKAHVALRSVEIVQQQILALVQDPAVQPSVKASLKVVSHDATLAAEQVGKGVVEVEAARAQLVGAETTSDRLLIANANLLTWINTLNARIAEAKAALKEVKTP